MLSRMTSYVALLRAVNLPSHNKVGAADLRDLAKELGFTEPRTLLQSGNLVFRATARSSAQVEGVWREAAKRRLGLDTDFFVRTAAEWKEVVAGNPFPREAKRDPGHLLVMPLSGAPGAAAVAALEQAISGRERVAVAGRTAYLVYPDGVGRSRLTTALIERKLGVRGTGRNWNTVLKLAAMLEE
jgi:uncharacterized protein (DUF1697 family)